MYNNLFKVTFSNPDLRSKSDVSGATDSVSFWGEQYNQCNFLVGGPLLFQPGYIINEVCTAYPQLFIQDELLIINYSPIELLLYLQDAASRIFCSTIENDISVSLGITNKNKKHDEDAESHTFYLEYYSMSLEGGTSELLEKYDHIIQSQRGFRVTKKSDELIELTVIYGKPTTSTGVAEETRTFTMHPYVFISEIINMQKTFLQQVMRHDTDTLRNTDRETLLDFVSRSSRNPLTAEDHFSLTDDYFSGQISSHGFEAKYPWHNLEQLFADHLEEQGLTLTDVERIIKEEEEKWRKENPGKELATERLHK